MRQATRVAPTYVAPALTGRQPRSAGPPSPCMCACAGAATAGPWRQRRSRSSGCVESTKILLRYVGLASEALRLGDCFGAVVLDRIAGGGSSVKVVLLELVRLGAVKLSGRESMPLLALSTQPRRAAGRRRAKNRVRLTNAATLYEEVLTIARWVRVMTPRDGTVARSLDRRAVVGSRSYETSPLSPVLGVGVREERQRCESSLARRDRRDAPLRSAVATPWRAGSSQPRRLIR